MMMLKIWTACFLLTTVTAIAQTTTSADGVVHVDITPSHSINSFNPDQALGSSIDVLSRSGIDPLMFKCPEMNTVFRYRTGRLQPLSVCRPK